MIQKVRYLLATPFWALSFVTTVLDTILMGIGNIIIGLPFDYKGEDNEKV